MTATTTLSESTSSTIEGLRRVLVAEAELRHYAHSQYRGFWNDWKVGQITRDIQWKGYKGEHFRSAVAGEFVLFTNDSAGGPLYGYVTAHLPNSVVGSGLGANTVIETSYVREVKAS